VRVAGVGVLTGWGDGVDALPADAGAAAAGRRIVPLPAPALPGERFRRATRECLLGVAAASAALRDAGLDREAVRGERTALVYVTAAAYGASNRRFIEAEAGGALHFPYTAPSAVPAEVTIDLGLTGRYVILIGGAVATLDALWQAGRLLEEDACERALVLAVETFDECADLHARARWLAPRPLVEAAACAVLVRGGRGLAVSPAGAASSLEAMVRRRAGETLACAPLIGLALARRTGDHVVSLTGEWRGRRARGVVDGAVEDVGARRVAAPQ